MSSEISAKKAKKMGVLALTLVTAIQYDGVRCFFTPN